MPEGRVVYSDEPLLEVTAPVAVAQIAETYLLNQITLHTTLASKAARYVLAAGGRALVDFAFRRTHGTEAAMAVARASAIVGFAATSNVEAARRYGLPVAGTMAHAFVEAFDSERDAFVAFAQDHPERATFLVDTYDTINGIATAIEVIGSWDCGTIWACAWTVATWMRSRVRRDRCSMTPDLTRLGCSRAEASTSMRSVRWSTAGAPIDAFGIGTQLGVSADAPSVDSVYKLTEYAGRPTMKFSAGKASAPGRKQVWRTTDDGVHRDTLSLRDEANVPGAGALLEEVMHDGRRLATTPTLADSRRRFQDDLPCVPPAALRLDGIDPVVVERSSALRALTASTRAEASENTIRS